MGAWLQGLGIGVLWALGVGLPPQPQVRQEYFVLQRGERIEGLARWVRHETAGRQLLEWETLFADGPQVSLVEVRDDRGRRLIWREYGAAAPTWVLEVDAVGGELLETRWGLGGPIHRSAALPEGLLFPLERAEAFRDPACGDWGFLPTVRPLGFEVVPQRVHRDDIPGAWPAAWPKPWPAGVERVLHLHDRESPGASGSCWSLGFRGRELVAYRLRRGGLWWRAIDGQAYRRLVASLSDEKARIRVPLADEEIPRTNVPRERSR